MKKIENREDLNFYYDKINNLIDDYIDKNKIKPSNLERYMKPYGDKFNKFIKRNKLDDVENVGTILIDVIRDRVAMEKDGVMQFESFNNDTYSIKSFNDCLSIGIIKADINYEKVLSDYYDTNLSDINIINSDTHLFDVITWKNKKKRVIVYSDEDMEIISNNIMEYLINKKRVKLLDGLDIPLIEIIDSNDFKKKISPKIMKIITNIIDRVRGCEFVSSYNGYSIFEFYAT
jgi:hypothetical protein